MLTRQQHMSLTTAMREMAELKLNADRWNLWALGIPLSESCKLSDEEASEMVALIGAFMWCDTF